MLGSAIRDASEDMLTYTRSKFLGRAKRCFEGTLKETGNIDEDETSLRRVEQESPAFRIDRAVVTCAQLQQCVDAHACEAGAVECRGDLAAVTLTVARDYCKFRGAELPTLAEWQRAARGTTGVTFPMGTGWNGECSRTTAPPLKMPRCLFSTSEGFQAHVRSPFRGEWTRDTDCSPEDSERLPVVVDLKGDRLDETFLQAIKAEFRCARETER
jgi:hypothetical protein